MDGNATSEGGTVDDHLFVRPNENTIIPSQLTANSPNGPLANLPSGFRYIPEDSCDSILSFDDQDEDDDEDAIDSTGKGISSSQSNRLYQASLTGMSNLSGLEIFHTFSSQVASSFQNTLKNALALVLWTFFA